MATYNGTNSNNTITGSSSDDTMNGLDGNDVLNGGAGNDTLDGGNHNDTLNGGTGNDKLYGRDGDDQLNGEDGDDTLDGGNNNDILSGGAGKDILYGGDGDDTLDGGEGDDKLYGNNGRDVMTGGAGNDYMDGGDGEDNLSGGDGNDTLIGGYSQDTLSGGAGRDVISGGDGDDRIVGGSGNDDIDAGTGQDVVYGDYDPATPPGAQSATVTFNSESADYKNTLGYYEIDPQGNIVGVKFIYANASASGSGGSLVSGSSATVSAAAGNNLGFFIVANGYAANNSYSSFNLTTGHLEFRNSDGSPATTDSVAPKLYYVSASGAATLVSGATYHAAAGSSGAPLALNADGKDHVTETLNSNGTTTLKFEDQANLGDSDFNDLTITVSTDVTASGSANYNDQIEGGDGDDKIYGQWGNDQIEGGQGQDELYGNDGNDTIDGDQGDDRIYGGDGNDTLRGDDNNDRLFGENGNDNLFGGTGDDQLDGGAGNDVVKGEDGNDTAIYVASENVGSHDVYEGNKGYDTLNLVLTQAQANSAAVQQEIAAYQAFMAANYNPNSSGGPTFHFNSFDLDVRGFETLSVTVIAPPNAAPDAVNDAASVTEDQVGSINVLANDSTGGDVGDSLTVSGVASTSALGVALTLNANGTVNYNAAGSAYLQTLKAGQTITDSFTYTVTDHGGATDTATVTVTITGVNDAPTVASLIADATTNEDAAFTLATAGNFADVDAGDTRAYSATLANGNPLPSWLTINAATGVLSGTPANGDVGAIAVKVTMTDGSGASATDTFVLTVANVNDAPTVSVAIPDKSTAEDAPFSLNVAGNFADADIIHGDSLHYTATLANGNPLPSWLSFNAATGQFTGTPANGDVGTIAVKVTAIDQAGAQASDTLNITVTNTNDGPVVSTAIPDAATPEDAVFTLNTASNFSDADVGDTRAYSATLSNGDPLPSWLHINAATGQLYGTPANGDVGTIAVKVTMTDGAGASANDTFNLTVTNVNDAPVVTVAIPDQHAAENAPFSYDTSSHFADDDTIHGDSLTYSAHLANGDPLPAWLHIDPATGVISGTPPDMVGGVGGQSGTVTFMGEGASFRNSLGVYEVDVSGNITGVKFVWDNSSRAGEGGALFDGVSTAPVSAAAGHTLGFFLISNGYDANGQYAGLDLVNGHLEFRDASGNPATTATTNPQLWYVGPSGSQQIGGDIFHSGPANLSADGLVHVQQTTLPDGSVQIGFEDLTGLGDQDFDDTVINLQLSGGAPSYEIVVVATDESGASTSDNFVLTIENVNDAPVVTMVPDQTTAEDAPFAYDLSQNFSDDDAGDSLTYVATLANGDPLPAWLHINPTTGQLYGTPANGDVGAISIHVTATDESGESVSDIFELTVTNVNDAPVVSVLLPNQAMAEDVPFSFNATGYFTDVDLGDSLTYSATLLNGQPLPSWLTIDPVTGVLSGVPGNGDVGNIGVVITVTDESGAHTSDAFGLTVANVNDVPVVTVAIADQATDEDAPFSYNAAANFGDVDTIHGDSLTYAATLSNGDPLPSWLSFNPATGQFAGTPANGDVGAYTITVTATDESGAHVADTFVLTVANVNDAPVVTVALADQATNEDAAFSYDASGAFADVDSIHGDVLSYSATLANGDPLPAWLSIDPATGALSGTPANGDVGIISVIVTATDLAGASASDQFDITVVNVNDAPVVTVAIADQATAEDAPFSYDASANFADVDLGDDLTYTATLANGDPLPAWLHIDPATGELSGTPANGDVGGYSVTVTATDGSGAAVSDSFDLTVTNVNDAPVVTVGIADAATNEDAAFSYDAAANFADDDSIHGDVLNYSATLSNGDPLPAWLSIDPVTGVISGTPANGDVGVISVIITATDLAGATATDSFDLTVVNTNDGPTVAVAIADQSTNEDAPFSLDVSGNFADVDLGDVLTFSATLSNGDPLPAWLHIDPTTGELSGTPNNGDVGGYSVTVTATDGSGAAVSDTFDLTVENVNDAPVVTVGIADATTNEDAAFSYDAAVNFADDDSIHGDVLSYSATLSNGDPLPAWLSIDPVTGQLSGTPENGDVGVVSIIVTATDLAGATASDQYDLTVVNTNDGPVVSVAISDATTAEDAPFSLDVSGNFADVDAGDVLSYSATQANGDPLPAWLSIDPVTGVISGTPANGDVGGYSVTVTATDGSGASVSTTFDLTVENVNDAPVVTVGIADAATNEDAAFLYDASANFADDDSIHGDVLSYSATLANGDPLPAWLSIDPATGEISGTPANGDVGTISIIVTATDLAGATASDSFDITVVNTNDGPTVTVAINDATTDEDAAFSYDVSGSFADDDAIHGDALTYTATLANGDPLPAWLSIDANTGELSGTPANGDVGTISVIVTATDLDGASASDTFDLTVENVNDAPVVTVAIADVATDEDAAFTLDAAAAFADDDIIHGDALTYTATLANGDPLPAWLVINPTTGELSGTPANGDVGVISIVVTATDLAGATATDSFDITVVNTNDGPVVSVAIPDQATPEDSVFTFDVAGNFADADLGDVLTYTATLANGDPLPSWLVFNPATGTFTGTPDNWDVGGFSVTVTATDGSGASVSDTFDLTVTNVNDAPVVTVALADQTVVEDAPFSYDTSSHFGDDDFIHGDELTYSATLADGSPLPSWLSIDPQTGVISGVLAHGQVGGDSNQNGTPGANTINGNGLNNTINGGAGNDTINGGAGNDDIQGGTGNDTIMGGVGNDLIDDVSGHDTIEGGAGNDTINGGSGDDTIYGDYASQVAPGGTLAITVTATDGSGATASDTFDLTFPANNDVIDAGSGSDYVDAGQGDDIVIHRVGDNLGESDIYTGNTGHDTLRLVLDSHQAANAAILQDIANYQAFLATHSDPNGDSGAVFQFTAFDLQVSNFENLEVVIEDTNETPVLDAPIADVSTDEDAAFSLSVAGNFADDDLGDSLTYAATLSNGDPLPSWLSFDANTGTFSGTPENGDVGTISVVVAVTDSFGETANDTFNITVTNVNDVPTVSLDIDDATTAEDAPFSLDVSGSFADVDLGDVLSYSATLANGDPLPAWLSIDPVTGVISGTPANGDVGAISIVVTATDLAGATAQDTFDLTVENTNDAPVVIVGIPDQTTAEDAAFSYDLSQHFGDDDLVHGDSISFDAVVYSATLPNGDPLPAWLSIDPSTGELSGTPENGDVGSLTIVVTATDSAGASVSASFSLTVENVNDAPVVLFDADPLATNEDEAFGYAMADHFDDADIIHGDVLTYSAALANGDALPSWLSIDPATGELTGTPANGDVGVISIVVTVTDVAGGTAATTLELTVDNVNDAPVVSVLIDDVTTDEDAPFSLDVSGNFADADLGDELTYTATLANGDPLPAWLSIDPATGELSGTPENGDVGVISIVVTVTDLAGGTAADEFDLTVVNTNDGPVVLADAVGAVEDTPVTYAAADLLANDFDVDAGDVLTISGVSNAVGGTVELTVDGDVLFTPDANYSGTATFDYTVSDGHGGTSTATVTVSVAAVADAPIVTAGDVVADEVPAPAPEMEGADQFVSNETTAGDQMQPSNAALADGNMVVVWVSQGQDGGGWGVYAKVYAPDGSAVSSELQVNSYASYDQLSPSVTGLADGGFVVTWASATQDGDGYGVYGQRFSAEGTPVGGEFHVSTETAGNQETPVVTSLEDGGFLVAWQSFSGTQDGSGAGIYAQRYDAAGNAVGGEFMVNTTTAGDQKDPVVTGLSDGGYVVAWQSADQDGWANGIFAQRFDAAGNAVGGEFQVNTYTIINQVSPTITALENGGFVVTWQSETVNASWGEWALDYLNQDASNWGVYSRIYDANGNPVSGEILVNTTTDGDQTEPSVTSLPDGGFLVTWTSAGQDGDGLGIYGQRFDAAGNKIGDEFLINESGSGNQMQSDVTTLSDGSIAVTWWDIASNGQQEIFTRVFTQGEQGSTIAVAGLDISAALGDLDGSESIVSIVVGDMPAGAVLSAGHDNGDGTWTLTPADLAGLEVSMPVTPPATYGLTVTVTSQEASNGATATTTIEFNLTVPEFNHAPIVTYAIADQTLAEETPFSLDASGHFADSDLGDVLTYTATLANGDPLPSWLHVDPQTGLISGTPDDPAVGTISVVVTATDEGGLSASDTFDLTVTNVNDAPVVTAPGLFATIQEDTLFDVPVGHYSFEDADAGDVLSYSATLYNGDPLPAWLSIDPATGRLTGTPGNEDVGNLTVKVFATDAAGETSAPYMVYLTVQNVNDAPVLTATIADGSAEVGEAYSLDVSGHFTDDDSIHGDVLSYTATLEGGDPLPSWLHIDPQTGVISGTPANGDIGAISIVVTATDLAGATATDTFEFIVTDVNDAPVLASPLADQATDEDAPFAYDVSGNFADDDLGDAITYTATLANGDPLPSWLAIDPQTGVISGTPTNGDVGAMSIIVTATDLDGLNASDTFDLTVNNVNDAPTLEIALGNDSTWIYAPFTYDTAGSFADVDSIHGDTLTYSATLLNGDPLPDWLSIDPVTGQLSGVPLVGDEGTIVVTVTATDAAGASASDSFNLAITPTESDGGTPSVQVNTWFANDQLLPAVTTLSNGHVVIVWSSAGPDGSGWAVMGREFEQDGTPIGEEFQVNTTSFGIQIDPSITNLADGGYVVSWTSDVGEGGGIYGQRYDAEGHPTGGEFQIDTVVDGQQDFSDIASLADGGFVVTWNSPDGFGQGVSAQRFDALGNKVGDEFRVNTTTDADQHGPSVVSLAGGGFVVTWTSEQHTYSDGSYVTQDGWGASIQFRLYDAAGNAVSGEIQANTMTTFDQKNASITAMSDGGFIIVWQSENQETDTVNPRWGIYGQRFDANGNQVGVEFHVNTMMIDEQKTPAITALTDGGYIVTWTSLGQDGSEGGIYGQRFDANGNPVGPERKLNDVTDFDQVNSELTALQNGGFAVAYDSYGQDGSGYGIFLRFFYGTPEGVENHAPTLVSPLADQSLVEGDSLSVDAAASFQDEDLGDTLFYYAQLASGQPLPSWMSIDSHTGLISGTPADGDDGIYQVVVTVTDNSGATANDTLQITVGNANPGDAFLVNDVTSNDQMQPSNAALANGNMVVVWASQGQDGGGWGIFAKVFSPDGSSLTAEIPVNSHTANDQFAPSVTGLADGSFVVTWSSAGQDGDGYGIYGQRFSADGTPTGGEFHVSTETSGNQEAPAVTALDDGGFLVVWQSFNGAQDGSGAGIYGQRFDAAGHAVGGEFMVNTTTDGNQTMPVVTGLEDGGYVVAWSSETGDSWLKGIFAQRYDAAGHVVGGEFQVNDYYISDQTAPSITALANGGFVVSWQSGTADWFGGGNQDSDFWGVYSRIYDADGNPVGGDILVNTETANQQIEPSITGLSDGGFYVTWTSDGQDGSGFGLYGQRFDADGHKVGGETLINDIAAGNQYDSSVIQLANGDIVVSWSDNPNDGSGNGVYSRVIELDAPLPNLFASGDDSIDFNTVQAGTYEDGTQYDAGDGNDIINLPTDAAAAALAGYDLGQAFHGGNDTDTIRGSEQGDVIFGDDGDDYLLGFGGEDTLIGGAGTDSIILSAADGSGPDGAADTVVATLDGGEDVVIDFEIAHDLIDVSVFNFADFSEIQANLSTNGSNDAVVHLPGGVSIILAGIDQNDLTADNFKLI